MALFPEDWSARLGAGQDQSSGDHDSYAARTDWSEGGGRAAEGSFFSLLLLSGDVVYFVFVVVVFRIGSHVAQAGLEIIV